MRSVKTRKVAVFSCDFCGANLSRYYQNIATCFLCNRTGCSKKHFRYFAEITEGSCSKVRIALCADCMEKRRDSAVAKLVKKLIEEADKIMEEEAVKEGTEGEEK